MSISKEQFLEIFALKLCEDPSYKVVLANTPDEDGGIELQASLRYSDLGDQTSIDISDIKQEFPNGVRISRMKNPIWTKVGTGVILCLCSVLPESSFENEAQALPETQLPATSHREMYEMVGKYASLPQWDDLSISKQKVIKHQIDVLLLIAKM